LIGIHLEGNSGAYADTGGFVCFKDEKKVLLEEAIASKRLIKGVEVVNELL
jgi:hypothetical protein